MELKVICQECGKIIAQVSKPQVTEKDIRDYEMSSSCQDHGKNVYNYAQIEETDELGNVTIVNGELLSSTIVVRAFRVQG